jgi:hypothetical protein
MASNQPDPHSLTAEIAALRDEVARLNRHRFVRLYNSRWQLLAASFVRGLAFGLGSVLGATILVSVVVYLLSTVNFIPILGEWAARVAEVMEQAR